MARPALPRDANGNIIRPKRDPFDASRRLIETNSRALTKAAIKLALDGNAPILNRLLALGLPTMRPAEAPVDFPGVSPDNEPAENARLIHLAVSTGKATAEQGKAMLELLGAARDYATRSQVIDAIVAAHESAGLPVPDRLLAQRGKAA